MTTPNLNKSEVIALGFVIVLVAYLIMIAIIDPQAFRNVQ